MARYVAVAPVFLKATGQTFMPGHQFDSEDFPLELVPAYAKPVKVSENATRDLSGMTKAQMLAEAEKLGLDVPDGATKAVLAKILGA